jgi:hypothetical protein
LRRRRHAACRQQGCNHDDAKDWAKDWAKDRSDMVG